MSVTIERATRRELAGGVRIQRTIHHYPVTGQSLESWLHVASLLGPRAGGRVFPAYTRWRVRWSYLPLDRDGRYVPSHVDVAATIDVHLPRWMSSRRATAATQEAWRRWESWLSAHEAEHEAIGRQAAAAVSEALAGIDANSERALEDEVARRTAEVIARHRALDATHDGRGEDRP